MERSLLLLLFFIGSPFLISGYNIPEPTPCDEYLNAQWGIISSPDYPFNYSGGRSCLQRIYFESFTSQNPKKICFTFYAFRLGSDDGCFNDYLEFPAFEGSSGLVRYCGNGNVNKNYPNETRSSVFSPHFCWPLDSGRPFDLRFRSMVNSSEKGYFAEYVVSDLTDSTSDCAKLSPICHPGPCAKNEFKCRNGLCIGKDLVCNGQSDCDDSSDEGYWHARCPVNGSIESCSFEDGMCGFTSHGVVRNSTSPWGPRFDHTFLTLATGNFVYFGGSPSSYLDYAATPSATKTDSCLSFWFYMAGYVGTLSLYVTDASGRTALAWFRRDNHGLMWLHAEVDLPATSFPLKEFRFEVTERSMDVNNIAIDDISLLQGTCYKSDISCTFELGSCGWRSLISSPNHIQWTIEHSQDSLVQEPLWPKEQSSSFKMFMNFSDCDGGKVARLISRPVVENVYSSSFHCLRFSYLGPVNGIGSLNVSVINYLRSATNVWKSSSSESTVWRDVVVVITSSMGPFQIAFEGSCSTAYYTGIAIDNIELTPGFCSPPIPLRTSAPHPYFTTRHPSGCHDDQYQCKFSAECVFRDRICDGKSDCGDQTDETDCPNTELTYYGNQPYVANDVIIGVSVVCVAIFLTVVIVIVIAARRRSIMLRIARARMMRRCADSVANDHFDAFPAFMEPKPPPYDFSPPIAPSYALKPPPYSMQDGDQPDAIVPPPYEMGRVGEGQRAERQVFDLGVDSSDEQNARRVRTTSI